MTIFVSEPVLLDEYGRKTLAYPDTDTGERPIFYCYAGPNGAGKTTFMKEHVDSRIPVIRPDQMVKEENIKDNFTLSELVRERMENL
ncbi:MAG: hypothetical protein MUD08_15035, partial [Cytophagales bacterium]|nr:hypothetical protein [Cytophagales bacterium]